jgi:hypothetical protein
MKRDNFTLGLDLGRAIKRTRSIWRGMRARCSNPMHVSYQRYGALGVAVCLRWSDFQMFLLDMGPAPVGMSIERLDGNGPYAPENCVWATPKQQARNRANNVLIEFQGKSLAIAEWAEIYGMQTGTLWRRLKAGASMELAVSRPLCRGKPMTGKQRPRKAKA